MPSIENLVDRAIYLAGAEERVIVYGGTFFPPHGGHLLTANNLAHGGRVIVVTSAGHEFKPESRATYAMRKVMARLAFGESALDVEDLIDPSNEWRGFLVLSKVREITGAKEIAFAIGPDIDQTTWAGFDEIVSAGFKFVRVPEVGVGLRSTQIRALLGAGDFEQAAKYIPARVMEYIVSETSREFWLEHA